MPQGLPRRIRLAFIAQAVIGSLLITLGILMAGLVVREQALTQRMASEAEAYWSGRAANPNHPLPSNTTLKAFVEPSVRDLPGDGRILLRDGEPPQELQDMEPGLHSLPGRSHMAFVDRRAEGSLFLVFSSAAIDYAILYTGLFSLLLSLLTVYLISWLTYRNSKRLVLPVTWLADVVSDWDPRAPDVTRITPEKLPPEAGSEVGRLSASLSDLAERMAEFVQREREFTRDASHELRTPLTVVRVATDLMMGDPDMPERSVRSLARVRRAGQDMEAVIDAFLILAREADVVPQSERFDAGEIVNEAVEKIRPLLTAKPVEINVIDDGAPQLFAPPHVLRVMVGNLLSNAARFTDHGRIDVHLGHDRIEIRDTGIGMSQADLSKAFDPFYRVDIAREDGKGMGLSIVRRLADRFGWPVNLHSTPGQGTVATIRFPG